MASNSWRHVGVDWDSGEWIAVGYTEDGEPEAKVYDEIETLWDDHEDSANRIVVDVPIGLCGDKDTPEGCEKNDGELSRKCDDLARKVIGARYPSVFTPPCREAAKEAAKGADYSEVNEINENITGKGLMQQAANIAPGIVEVDQLLRDGDGDQETLVEGHPEVCFRAFADDDLQFNKQTAPGMVERLTAMEDATDFEFETWRTLAESLGDAGDATGADDLLDALALALTAMASEEEDLHRLPDDPPTEAGEGEDLPMQMVYRRDEPFDVG